MQKFLIFNFAFLIIKRGGHEGTRTPNFLLVREAVYQLTYVPENLIIKPYYRTCAPQIFKKNRPLSINERIAILSNTHLDCQVPRPQR